MNFLKKKKKKRKKKEEEDEVQEEPRKKKTNTPLLSDNIKKTAAGIVLLLLALIVLLGFFGVAGKGGEFTNNALTFLFGNIKVFFPILLMLSGLVYFRAVYENFLLPLLFSFFAVMTGFSGIAASIASTAVGQEMVGDNNIAGWWGTAISSPFINLFGFFATQVVFILLICIGSFVLAHLINKDFSVSAYLKDLFSRDYDTEPQTVKRIMLSSEREKEPEEDTSLEIKKKEGKEVNPIKRRSDLPLLIPPVDLLDNGEEDPDPGDTKRNSSIIKKTFGDFDINVAMGEINVGPAVTQYTLKPADGVKLTRITSLSDDLALALAMHPVRTEAPIPGKSLVGIEVPNRKRAQITLGSLIKRKEFFDTAPLSFAVGKDVGGEPVFANLAKMPHMLVAGSTGSGKTIFLNTCIVSLLYKNSPQDLRFILVDPKRVEFSLYANLPHLLTPIIYDAEKATGALSWLVKEMERRFKVLAEVGSRNITGYHEIYLKNKELERMPFIALVVDELADLMSNKGNEIEAGIVRIAQMARAVGIHLILATQRPSVEVITGLIKANFPARVSFRVASQIDSRTILDTAGAEKLLGMGDMLLLSTENSKPRRIQAPFMSEGEARRIVGWLIENKSPEEEDFLAENIEESLEKTTTKTDKFDNSEDEDVLFEDAKQIVISAKKASASLLQRRLRIGYARAARLLDILEFKGIVGPAEGAKPREVYERLEAGRKISSEMEGDPDFFDKGDEDSDNDNNNDNDESNDGDNNNENGWSKV